MFEYEILKRAKDSHAHLGRLSTPHGSAMTPAFVFCATRGSIKAVETHTLRECGVEIILANTYHLMLRPGAEVIQEAGGLHAFMGWDGPMLTDSGGYQIFAMGHGSVSAEIKRTRSGQGQKPSLLGIAEEGARFKSYVDGSEVFLSPERAMEIQHQLGADFVVQLDECTPYHVSEAYTAAAMKQSLRWADRSLAAYEKVNPLPTAAHAEGIDKTTPHNASRKQACYGVLQGGIYPHLREQSARGLMAKDFFSIAVGGSLGENISEMHKIVSMSMDTLRQAARGSARGDAIGDDGELTMPIHLLGIGDRRSIFHGVREGIATFDCVSPTRLARHGHAILPVSVAPKGLLNLFNAQYRHDHHPLDPSSDNPGSRLYTRAYIHHLLKAKELSAYTILSKHNISQMTRMMRDIRQAIDISDAALRQCEQTWCGDGRGDQSGDL